MALFTGHTITPDSALGGKVIEKSLRFNGDDTYLNRTPSTAGNRSKWTWSAWIKRTHLGTAQDLYSAYDARGFYNIIRFGTTDQLNFQSNSAEIKKTNRRFRDTTSWYHIVVVVDTPNTTAADRVIIYVNGSRETLATDNQVLPSQVFAFNTTQAHTLGVYANGSSYNFDGYMADIHFRDGQALDPTYFGYTESQTGMWLPKPYTGTFTNVNSNSLNDGTTWNSTYANAFNGTATDSGAGDGAYTGLNSTFTINFPGDGVTVSSSLQFQGYAPASSQSAFDTYVDIYVNGTERTTTIVSGSENGTNSAVYDIAFTGTMTSLRMQSKPTSNNGISQVIVDGEILINGLDARGNNSFHLDFIDNSGTTATTLGKDISGNANNYTPNNFSVSAGVNDDSVEDTPNNNYCVLNAIDSQGNTPADGSLRGGTASTSGWRHTRSTALLTSGKWYWEVKLVDGTPDGSNGYMTGIAYPTFSLTQDVNSDSRGMYGRQNQEKYLNDNSNPVDSDFTTTADGDILQYAWDVDGGKLYVGKNNSWEESANPSAGTNPNWTGVASGASPMVGSYGSSIYVIINFGQQGFTYTPPTGYRAINSKNLATPSSANVIRPQRHFDTLLYSGTGSSNIVGGLEFKPDFLWVKCRTGTGNHLLIDSIRGGTKSLDANNTDVESSAANRDMTFLDNGMRWNSNSLTCNENSQTYVAWCWKAGGAAVSNSDGTITSSISVNQKAGFSIVSYTGNGTAGATVGHGLGKKPEWIILIRRDSADNRYVYHQFMNQGVTPEQHYSELNFHAGATDSNKIHNDTAPTTSVFSLSNDNASNGNTYPYIAYCWTEIPGYSKFGEYRANGIDTNGPYVHLGFKPAWVMIKSMSLSNSDWTIFDNKRNTYNPTNIHLAANQNHADGTDTYEVVDFLSHGFRVTGLGGAAINYNTSYPLLLYMAFAEQPSETMFGLDANAR